MSRPLKPWELVAASPVLTAAPWLSIVREHVRLPNGDTVDDYYRVVLPDYAVVAAFTTADELVMVREYKHGLGRISLNAPAGMLDPGEDPLAGAKRELREETGYTSNDWHLLGEFVTDGNRHCGKGYVFMATNAQPAVAHFVPKDEPLIIELLKRDAVWKAIESGDVALMPTVTALSLAMAHAGRHMPTTSRMNK